jgi:hypothetical protein
MKARIKLVEQAFNREIRSGDIVDIDVLGKQYLDKESVLKVFDEAIDDIPAIRKAIEDMKG